MTPFQSQPSTIAGTVEVQNGRTVLVGDDDGQSWVVNNPNSLSAYSGRHVQVSASVDSEAGALQVNNVLGADVLKTRHDG